MQYNAIKYIAFGLALMAAPALAEMPLADAVTVESIVDRAEMVRIADAIDAAVDAKDWGLREPCD